MRITMVTISPGGSVQYRHATLNGWCVIYDPSLSRPYSLTSLSLCNQSVYTSMTWI